MASRFVERWSPIRWDDDERSAGSSSSWKFHKSTLFDGIDDSPLTDWQRVRRELARGKKPRRSFLQALKNAGEGGLSVAEWVLDKAMRPSYAVNEAMRAGLEGGRSLRLGKKELLRALLAGPGAPLAIGAQALRDMDFGEAAHGAREGFMGRKRTDFEDVLEQEGVLKGHGRLRSVAGFLGDVAFDPTTYLSGGTGAIVRGSSKPAFRAAREVMKDIGRVESPEAAAEHLSKLMPNLRTLRSAGPDFTERAALADTRRIILEDILQGKANPINAGLLSQARAGAHMEELTKHSRGLTLGLDIPFANKTVRTAPLPVPVPGLKAATKLPIVGKLAQGVGDAFSPGFRDPVTHAHEMVRTHQAEELSHRYFQTLRVAFDGMENLSERKQVEALHFFEKKGADGTPSVIKKGGRYVLNPKRLAQAQKHLSEEQIEFVKRWQESAEFLAERDRIHGIEYKHMGEEGRVYAPHIVKKDGTELSLTNAQRNLLSQRGFTKKRDNEYSIADLHKLAKWGILGRDVETNPFQLLAMRARSGANQHADATMVEYLKRTHGTPTRLVDKPALQAAEARLEEVKRLLDEHPGVDRKDFAAELELAKTKLQRAELIKSLGREKSRGNRGLTLQVTDQAHFESPRPTAGLPAGDLGKRFETLERIRAERRATLKAIDKGTHPALQPLIEQHAARRAELAALKKELRNLPKEIEKLRAGERNPAVKDQLMSTLKNRVVRDEHGHDYAFTPDIHAALTRLEPVANGNPAIINDLAKTYHKYYGKWKMAVTVLNPFGYGARNTVSDFWNMYIDGVPTRQIVQQGAKAANILHKAKKGDPKAVADIVEMYHQGVLSGLYDGDVLKVASALHHSGSKRAFLRRGKMIGLVNKIAQDINRNRENWGRMTHYLYRRDAQGMSVAEAAARVKKAHFDYEDLAPADRWIKDNAAPFWTWTRKNIPFQLQAALSRPGKYSVFPKAINALEDDSAEGDIVPDYVRKRMMLKAFGGYYSPMVGVTDLNKLDPRVMGKEAINMTNPIVKVPFELALNRSALTGRDIEGPHARNPINDRLAGLLSLIPGSDVGPTERQGVRGMGAAPWLTHLLASTPQTNKLVNQRGKIKSATAGDKPVWLSFLGLDATRVDQKKQREFEDIDLDKLTQKEVRRLRDLGLLPPAKKRKKSRTQARTDAMLYRALEGR